MKVRACRRCGESKPVTTGYHRVPTGRDGHRRTCKTCFHAIAQARLTALTRLAALHPDDFARIQGEELAGRGLA